MAEKWKYVLFLGGERAFRASPRPSGLVTAGLRGLLKSPPPLAAQCPSGLAGKPLQSLPRVSQKRNCEFGFWGIKFR